MLSFSFTTRETRQNPDSNALVYQAGPFIFDLLVWRGKVLILLVDPTQNYLWEDLWYVAQRAWQLDEAIIFEEKYSPETGTSWIEIPATAKTHMCYITNIIHAEMPYTPPLELTDEWVSAVPPYLLVL